MAAVIAPFSLELTADEDAREAVAGAVVTVVATKMKIFMGVTVDLSKIQSVVGSLRSCFRLLMAEVSRGDAGPNDQVAFGNYLSATAGSITIAGATAGVGAFDVALVVSGTFGSSGGKAQTHMFTETFNQLIDVLLESLSEN